MTAWSDRVFIRVWGAAFGRRRQQAARAMWLGRFSRTVAPGSGVRLRLRWCRWRRDAAFSFAPAAQVVPRNLRYVFARGWRRSTGWAVFVVELRQLLGPTLELRRWAGRGERSGIRSGPARWRIGCWPRAQRGQSAGGGQ